MRYISWDNLVIIYYNSTIHFAIQLFKQILRPTAMMGDIILQHTTFVKVFKYNLI